MTNSLLGCNQGAQAEPKQRNGYIIMVTPSANTSRVYGLINRLIVLAERNAAPRTRTRTYLKYAFSGTGLCGAL